MFLSPEDNIVQYAAECRSQSTRLKSYSCSETPQDDSGLTTPQDESLNKLCDDVAARIEARIRQQRLNEQRYLSLLAANANFSSSSAYCKQTTAEGKKHFLFSEGRIV